MADAVRRSVTTSSGWRVLLPPGWDTLPTEPEAARKAIAVLLDRTFKGKARDELVNFRIDLDRGLREQVRQAAKAGANYVHVLTRPMRGLPVSASLIAVPFETRDPNELASALSYALGDASGVVENGNVDLGNLGALRRLRRDRTTIGDASGEREVMTTSVDFVVLLPDESLVILTFATTTEPVHEELVMLFDAIAGTLHLPDPPAAEHG